MERYKTSAEKTEPGNEVVITPWLLDRKGDRFLALPPAIIQELNREREKEILAPSKKKAHNPQELDNIGSPNQAPGGRKTVLVQTDPPFARSLESVLSDLKYPVMCEL